MSAAAITPVRRWTAWIAVGLFDLVAALFLQQALLHRAALALEPAMLVRGAPIASAVPGDGSAAATELTGPAVDTDGLLDMARLVVPGYDPPEVRADPTALTLDRLPPVVQAVHGQTLRARGYVIPIERDRGSIIRFLLSRYPPGCCFGALPVLDEWIEVTFDEGIELPADRDSVVEATGRLEAGEVLDADGYALSLYRMAGKKVEHLR